MKGLVKNTYYIYKLSNRSNIKPCRRPGIKSLGFQAQNIVNVAAPLIYYIKYVNHSLLKALKELNKINNHAVN